MAYDSKPDTLKHISLVQSYLHIVADWLIQRSERHDASKLISPEKEMFDVFRPKLDTMDVNSAEYKQALIEMGDALQHHYQMNSHHPEHYPNGIAGMNLLDVIEMVCDWKAAADKKGQSVSMEWARKRFKIDPQLENIISNTLDLLK